MLAAEGFQGVPAAEQFLLGQGGGGQDVLVTDGILLADFQRAVYAAEAAADLLQLGYLVAVALAQGGGAVLQTAAELGLAQGR